jgi:hypothetical protein
VRADRAFSTDAAFEARTRHLLEVKILAGGGIAIGGTIDESTTQPDANISLRSTGDATIKGKVELITLSYLLTILTLLLLGLLILDSLP